MDGGKLIIFCLFCEFIVIRANRKVTNALLRTFLFPMKLGVRSKTSSYFFTTHSRFAFILFCFFAVSFALALLVADSLISSQLRIFPQYETALMNFSIGLGLGDYEWCNRRLHLKERL